LSDVPNPNDLLASIRKSFILCFCWGKQDGRLLGGLPEDKVIRLKNKETSVGSSGIRTVGPIGVDIDVES
jgi:hypothetical protein